MPPAPPSSPNWIALTPTLLDIPAALAFVTDPAAGATTLFLGTTRIDTNPAAQPLLALDYQAYPEMALPQLHDFATRAHARWPITKLALLHRTGRVLLAEPSVLIALSTPHRADAFDACRWLIDTLKTELTVWKQEVWSDGTESWVHPGEST